jgi:hypothetical protein
MDRRQFFTLRRQTRSRTFELSCRWLYMKCLDTQVTGQLASHTSESDLQHGEGPAVFDARTTRQLFDDLDRQLRGVETVQVTDMQWLTGDLRREFGDLMRAFRARGGRVEIKKP